MIIKANEVVCTECFSPEMHPDGDKLLIRGYKVHDRHGWWSQCLVCAGYYNDKLEEVGDPMKLPKGGWFLSD